MYDDCRGQTGLLYVLLNPIASPLMYRTPYDSGH